MVVRHGFNQSQHRINRLIQRGVGAIVDARCFDQDIQLCDQLNAQHDHLLVKNVAGFRPSSDLV